MIFGPQYIGIESWNFCTKNLEIFDLDIEKAIRVKSQDYIFYEILKGICSLLVKVNLVGTLPLVFLEIMEFELILP